MSSNFNNAKIINVYYNKGDRKPYDVNGKPIAYIGEEAIGATEATTIRFYLGEDLDSSTAVIVTKRPDGERRLDLCEKIGTGVNSYYQVTLNAWYGGVKGKATLAFKVYNGEVEFDDEETPTEIISVEGRIVVSDIFNLEIAYAPEADLIVPADDTPDYVEWFAALSTKLDKAQSITVTGALPTLTGDVYDDRYFYVENEGTGRLYYINGSTAIEVVWQVGTLRLTPTGNGDVTADTGKLFWNQPNGTVNVGLYNNVNVGVGEDVFYYVKASGAITKGDVIQYAGYQGDHALAKRAVQSEVNANPKLIMGIAKQNITNGDFGYVAHFGKIESIDTKSQAVNSFVWFDSAGATAGNWTITQPTAPNAKILLGVIIKAESSANANNGVILVRPIIEPKLEELQNVLITSVANGNVLSYDGTKWVNSTRLTTAETNITNIQNGTTIVGKANADKDGNEFDATYLKKTSASSTYVPLSSKGQPNGVAPLGADNKILSIHLPGGVDDIKEFANFASLPLVGEASIIYVTLDTNKIYRWSGSAYVEISSSLALGETSSTAYRGDRGKIAYDYSQVGHLPLAGGTVTGNLVVGGDLTISGTTTTINTETVGIEDNLILINSNQTGTPSTALKGGLEIERGDLTNFQFVFDESDDRFKVGQVGSLQTVATRTDDGTIANRGITFFNTSTNRLENITDTVITSDGGVGVGLTTLTQKLSVNGNVGVTPSAFATEGGIHFGDSGTPTWSFVGRRANSGDLDLTSNVNGSNITFQTRVSGTLSEKMRITNAGNVGIGTASPDHKLTISGGLLQINDTAGSTTTGKFGIYSFGGIFEINPRTSTGGFSVVGLAMNSSGNVGIGTTSPTFQSGTGVVIYNDGTPRLEFRNSTTGTASTDGAGIAVNTSILYIYNKENGATVFDTNNTERMRITGGGEVYIAGTTDQGAYNLQVNGTGVWGAGAYVNGSDRRLKTNINAIQTGLDVIEKLNPVTFNYIEEYSKDINLQTGFIAQEMLEAMSGKDYVDSIVQKGKEFYGVAYQSLIPILVKAVQELTKRIKELETK